MAWMLMLLLYGKATISWRRLADTRTEGDDTITNYTVASYDLEWVVIEADALPTTDADGDGDADVWDDATPEEYRRAVPGEPYHWPVAGQSISVRASPRCDHCGYREHLGRNTCQCHNDPRAPDHP